MDVRSLLTEISQPVSFTDSSVVLFSSKTYPLLFFSLIFARIKEQRLHTIIVLDLESRDEASCKAQLETPFLGTQQWYWLGDLTKLSVKQKTAWLQYCGMYKGPHVIFAFASQVPVAISRCKEVQLVDLDLFEVPRESSTLISFFFADKKYEQLWKQVEKKISTSSIDSVCMISQYLPLLGAQTDKFIAEWVDLLISPDRSLFTLSTYFFAKKIKPFYSLWRNLHTEYPPQFWAVYWSEQITKAYGFIVYQKHKNFTEAKKIAYRLPFSFIKTDWQKISLNELQQAHDLLYQFDFHIKNGGTDNALDLFYGFFFTGTFAKEKSDSNDLA